MTRPSAFLAARPIVWMSEVSLRKKALFVRVENGDELDFGHVQPLAQQVDAAQHVKFAAAQPVHDVDPLERIDVAVHVPHLTPFSLR